MRSYLAMVLAAFPSAVLAVLPLSYLPAEQLAPGIGKVAAQLAAQAGHELYYPGRLPASAAAGKPARLYPSSERQQFKNGSPDDWLYLDEQANCNGAHYCNVGSVEIVAGGKIESLRDRQGHVITQRIRLANGLTAFFTPGHALADYWPAQLQWQRGGDRYTLSWRAPAGQDEAAILKQLAASLIAAP